MCIYIYILRAPSNASFEIIIYAHVLLRSSLPALKHLSRPPPPPPSCTRTILLRNRRRRYPACHPATSPPSILYRSVNDFPLPPIAASHRFFQRHVRNPLVVYELKGRRFSPSHPITAYDYIHNVILL